MRQRPGIAFALACGTSALAACLSFGDLSGGDADAGTDGGTDGGSTHVDAGADVGFPITRADGGCDFATPFGAPQPLVSLNTKFSDQAPRLAPDQLSIFFSSNSASGGDSGIAIFTATRPAASATFGVPAAVTALSAAGSAVSQPSITGDGLTIYFQTQSSGDGPGHDGAGTSIYFATRANVAAEFGAPEAVAGVRYASLNVTPFIRADGNVLYFSSYDATAGSIPKIVRAVGTGAGAFGPASTEDELNSANPTASPVVTPDDLSIFYATVAPGGAYEIYKGQRASATEPFTSLQPVSELSSVSVAPAWVSADACTLYFYEVVGADINDVDMYFATRPK